MAAVADRGYSIGDMKLGRRVVLRLLVALVATGVWWWIGVRFGGVEVRPQDAAGKFTALIWFMFTGIIWWVTLGLPAIIAWGESWGNLFWPTDKSMRIRPEYSIAEARAREGRYAEAIAAFRGDIVKFPQEVYPHTRIADLLLVKLKDPDGAIVELEAALAKATREDGFALVANRLADLLVQHRQDRAAARALLRQVQERFPNTKHARAAAERLTRLTAASGPSPNDRGQLV